MKTWKKMRHEEIAFVIFLVYIAVIFIVAYAKGVYGAVA